MAKYVEGFVLPVPKKNLQKYRRIARRAGEVWRDHGALEYVECVKAFCEPHLPGLASGCEYQRLEREIG